MNDIEGTDGLLPGIRGLDEDEQQAVSRALHMILTNRFLEERKISDRKHHDVIRGRNRKFIEQCLNTAGFRLVVINEEPGCGIVGVIPRSDMPVNGHLTLRRDVVKTLVHLLRIFNDGYDRNEYDSDHMIACDMPRLREEMGYPARSDTTEYRNEVIRLKRNLEEICRIGIIEFASNGRRKDGGEFHEFRISMIIRHIMSHEFLLGFQQEMTRKENAA